MKCCAMLGNGNQLTPWATNKGLLISRMIYLETCMLSVIMLY